MPSQLFHFVTPHRSFQKAFCTDTSKDAEHLISAGDGGVGRPRADRNGSLFSCKPACELLYVPVKGKAAQTGFE